MLRSIDELTPQTLTLLLRQALALPDGQVIDVQYDSAGSNDFGKVQMLYHLRVRYSGGGDRPPERIFLKFGRSHKEKFFYTQLAPAMPEMPLLHCYFAGYDPQTDRTCLLLEDLSTTHTQTEWPLPPDDGQCEAMIDALARLHARWWQDARLESDLRPALPAGRSWKDRMELAVQTLPVFLDFLGDRLSAHRRVIYRQVLASGQALDAAPGSPNLTLIHGDMHAWNVLFPRQAQESGLRIFDWNMWDIGRPTDDLAYMIAQHWYPERRSRLERPLLARYAERLAAQGVNGYSQEALCNDYRLSVARCLFIPVWQWQRGIHPSVWWPHLERAMLAFDDLNCREVL